MSDEQRVIELGIAGLTDATEVGRGGFATVYRARQPMLDRTVAVKVIHGTVVDPLGGERFLPRGEGRRAPVAAPQRHPRLTTSAQQSANQPYLIMPYYPRTGRWPHG